MSEQRCACMSSPTSASSPSASCLRIVRRRIERQHAIEQIDRARLLAERLAAPMQLDVRLLQLLDRRPDRSLPRRSRA